MVAPAIIAAGIGAAGSLAGGLMGSSSESPDYAGMALLQSQLDQEAARRETTANRPSQFNPLGSITWDVQKGAREYSVNQEAQRQRLSAALQGASAKDAATLAKMQTRLGVLDSKLAAAKRPGQQARLQKLADALQGKIDAISTGQSGQASKIQGKLDDMVMKKQAPDEWVQTEKWAPELEAATKSILGAQQRNAETIAKRGDFSGPAQVQWDPAGAQKYGTNIYESLMNRVRPEQAQQQEQFRTRLAQMGLQPGTPAYDRAMQNMLTSHGDVAAQAALEAQVQGAGQYRSDFGTQLLGQGQNYEQKLGEYKMPWEMASASQGLLRASSPNFQGFGTAQGAPAPDMIGAAQSQYSAGQQADANRAAALTGAINTGINAYRTFNKPTSTGLNSSGTNWSPSGMSTDY